jgi:predicted phage tail protein
MSYEEKKQARIQRLRDRAEKKRATGESLLSNAQRTADRIPMGQPILVGHHSEKRHRRDLNRIHNQTGKGLDLLKEADRLEDRADNAENNTSISSDDNEAVKKLKDKLVKLEKQRQEIKDHNKKAKEKAPSYLLSNLSQNIRSVKKRIEQLEEIAKIENTEEEINGVSLVVNTADNRVQLVFDGKPEKEIRQKLKRHGFKWAPSVGAWQRMLSNQAIGSAKDILKGVL